MNLSKTNYIFLFILLLSSRSNAFDTTQLDFPPVEEEVEIYNLNQLNSKGLDFCAIPYKEGVIFTSSRYQEDGSGMKNMFNKNYFDLYYAKKSKRGKYSTPQKLKGNINGRLHDGTATFNQAGNIMYFTRNNQMKKGKVELKIYAASLVEGQWINVKELPFNSTKFSNCHPTLSKDETKLYFASDRPGGFGAMDIYVSTLKNGVWGEPQNLGVNINSDGNELFPFVDDEGNLYLSSDGKGTHGRLDIFKAKKDGKRFSKKKNMGEPFNTRSDDFGFFIDKNNEQGFLSSNRLGGHGSDDLYGWKFSKKMKEGMTRKIIVIDESTGKKIKNAEVAIEQELGDWNRTVLNTVEKGVFVYEVKNSEEYFLNVSSNGFINYEMVLGQKELLEKEEITVSLKKKTFSLLTGKVEGQIYHNALEGVEVELLNECNGERSFAKTSGDGSFGFTIMCGCEYIVIAKKDGFMTSSKIITKDETPCDNTQLVEKKIQLRPAPNSKHPRASRF